MVLNTDCVPMKRPVTGKQWLGRLRALARCTIRQTRGLQCHAAALVRRDGEDVTVFIREYGLARLATIRDGAEALRQLVGELRPGRGVCVRAVALMALIDGVSHPYFEWTEGERHAGHVILLVEERQKGRSMWFAERSGLQLSFKRGNPPSVNDFGKILCGWMDQDDPPPTNLPAGLMPASTGTHRPAAEPRR